MRSVGAQKLLRAKTMDGPFARCKKHPDVELKWDNCDKCNAANFIKATYVCVWIIGFFIGFMFRHWIFVHWNQ